MGQEKPDRIMPSTAFLSGNSSDINGYDTFVENWQELLEENPISKSNALSTQNKIREIEQLTYNVLERLAESDTPQSGKYSGSKAFRSLNSGAVICDDKGIMQSVNNQAAREFGLHEELSFRDVGIELEDGKSIQSKFSSFTTNPSSGFELKFLRCQQKNGTLINLAAMALPEAHEKTSFLVVFMTTPWDDVAQNLLISQYGLSETEAEIVGGFAIGTPLRQLAIQRRRSYATIRNQFQAVLEKTGCASQTELMRLLLGTSYLFAQIQTLAKETETFKSRKFEIIRQNGRILEVQLLGDMAGQPFICLSSVFGVSATPAIEAYLRKKKLLMLGVSRPGFGGTSPPNKKQDLYECLAGDISALLDNMEIKSCVFMGRVTATLSLVNLARLIPERISRAYAVNAMIPRRFISQGAAQSKWAVSLVKATRISPSIATFILIAGHKVLLRIGVESFLLKMYANSSIDKAALGDREIVQSISQGIASASQQGYTAGGIDFITGYEDWSTEVRLAKQKIFLLQGQNDPHIPIDASRAFARELQDNVELIEFPDGGGLLNYTHFEKVLDIIHKN